MTEAERPYKNAALWQAMTELGFKQEELAERINDAAQEILGIRVNATDRHVRRWLSGEVACPQERYLIPLEHLFGRSAADLGFRLRRPPTARHKVLRTLRAHPQRQENSPVLRREFFGAASSVLAVAAVPMPASGRIGMSDVTRVYDVIRHLHQHDDRYGGDTLADQAGAYLQHVRDAMRRCVYGQRVEKALYTAMGELAASAGWFAFDAGDQHGARQHYNEALRCALLAGDRLLQVRVWNSLAIQALYVGQVAESATIAHAALDVLGRRSPRLVSLLQARAAVGHARCGERGQAGRALAQAETALDRAEREPAPPWLAFFGPAELSGLASVVHFHLGHLEAAEDSALDALSAMPAQYGRNRCYYTVHLAMCQFASRNVEEAADTASKALELLSLVRSPRVTGQLRQLDARLRPYSDLAPVRNFTARYDTLTCGRETG